MSDNLPPLPKGDITYHITDSVMRQMECDAHSDRQMQAYARAAIEADRVSRDVPAMKHVCNLWVDPETQGYVVDSLDHPLDQLIPAYVAASPQPQPVEHPRLTVRLTSFPESNGRRNWTALLVRVDAWDGLIGNCGGITHSAEPTAPRPVAGLVRCEFDDECDFCKTPSGGTFTRLTHNAEDVTEAEFYICGDCTDAAISAYTAPPKAVPLTAHQTIRTNSQIEHELEAMKRYIKQITKDKSSAVAFLSRAGIIDGNGELAEQYRAVEKANGITPATVEKGVE